MERFNSRPAVVGPSLLAATSLTTYLAWMRTCARSASCASVAVLASAFALPATSMAQSCPASYPDPISVVYVKGDPDPYLASLQHLRVGQSVQLQVFSQCLQHNSSGTILGFGPILADLSNQATWYVQYPSVATVTPTGLVTALQPGFTFLRADGVNLFFGLFGTPAAVIYYAPRFVFAPDDCSAADDCSEGSVSVFTVDSNYGQMALVPGSPFSSGGQYALSVAPHPTLSLVFVLNEFVSADDHSTGTVQIFSVDPASGVLSPASGPISSLGYDPGTITTDPAGKFVLVANKCVSAADCTQGSVAVFSFDPATTTLSPVGIYGSGDQGSRYLTVAPSGKSVYVTNVGAPLAVRGSVTALTMDPSTGALTGVGVQPAGYFPSRVAIDPFSRFAYVVSYCTFSSSRGNLDPCFTNSFVQGFAIDPRTGALSQLGGFPFFLPAEGSGSLTMDPLGQFLYVDNGNTTIVTESIDPSTGTLAPVGLPLTLGPFEPHPSFLISDPSGKLIYAIARAADPQHEGVAVFARSGVTGVLTQVAGSAFAEPLISLEQIAVMGGALYPDVHCGGPANMCPPSNFLNRISMAVAVPLRYGQTYQYIVTATLDDGTTEFVTSTVKWTTSNPLVATISANGLATAVGPGTATITACFTFLYCASSTVNATAFRLSTAVSPFGAGTISPASGFLYPPGASVQVSAAAKPGYTFSGFSGALTGNTTPQTLTLNSDALVTANFAPLQPSLTASVGPRTDAFAAGTRNVPITLMNSGKAAAANASIVSISDVAVISGSGTVFALSAVFPENLGAIPIGGSATGNVIFNWPATATRVRFTVNFGADGGYAGSTVITSFR